MTLAPPTWYIYIIECRNNTLYTGITTNIDRRFEEHKKGRGARYTRFNPPIKIVHTETCPTRTQAMKRERAIKKLPPHKKRALFHSD